MKLAIDPHVEQATQLLSFQNHSRALASSLKDHLQFQAHWYMLP